MAMGAMTAPDAIALAALCIAAMRILTGPIGRAVADRIRGRREESAAADPALGGEVEQLRARLAEVEERVDFAERVLTRSKQPDQIPGGA